MSDDETISETLKGLGLRASNTQPGAELLGEQVLAHE